MDRRVEDWSVEDLQKKRDKISFPGYQREPNLWTEERKSLLIDSILKDIDIPKLYFNLNNDGTYEVIDGQQRLWAVWEFLDGGYQYDDGKKLHRFADLTPTQRNNLKAYEFQITVFKDAGEDYLRELFLRLQLGLLLITGEKLHASTGQMKDFVFGRMKNHPFIQRIGIPNKRYAKETLCAQIAINSFTRAKNGNFARTRYEDLLEFFKEYGNPQGTDAALFKTQTGRILETLDALSIAFGTRTAELRNRSYVLSVYLNFERLTSEGALPEKERRTYVEFLLKLWKRLKDEVGAGFDRKNRELYSLQSLISSAPGEKYQIERRDEKLGEFFAFYLKEGRIKGDK